MIMDTLRDTIDATSESYLDYIPDMNIEPFPDSEVLGWAVEEYGENVGGALHFTADDWRTCREYGLTMEEVLDLIHEPYFSPYISDLGEATEVFLDVYQDRMAEFAEDPWAEGWDKPPSKEELADFRTKFCLWRERVLLTATTAYWSRAKAMYCG